MIMSKRLTGGGEGRAEVVAQQEHATELESKIKAGKIFVPPKGSRVSQPTKVNSFW
jgi:hypothetical protein